MSALNGKLLASTAVAAPAVNPALAADHFTWTPSIDPSTGKCHMVVVHKFTKREWRREFAENEWPAVRAELLTAIERDLTTPTKEAPAAQ